MAGSRIKGLTVQIGGDTTGLEQSLKNVNSTIKNTQSQLKDVERLLKLDPSNTELLNQKQRLLSESITATKEKLDALKTAQEQAKQQMENGDLGKDKYEALQREIIDTENELEKLAKKAGETNTALIKIEEAGKTIEDVGKKVTSVGSSLTKNVTAPIAAIGAASIAAFSEVDGAMDTLITKTGASGDELEKMQDIVTDIATSMPTDFQTAGEAVGEVASRFDDVGDSLEEISTKFIKFAQINEMDVSSAVDSVQASMAAFGVQTADTGLVLDTLNAIGQQTGTDIGTLTSLLTANAGVAKETGMSYEEAAVFLGTLNKNGVDTSTAMVGLKAAWKNSVAEGKDLSDTLSEMNDRIKKAKTDTEAYTAATELFGAKAGPAIAEAVRSGRLSLDELGISMEDYAGNLESTFEATLDPIDQNTILLNELKALGADLAGTIQEMLLPIMESLREKLHQLREWWNNLSESQQENIIKIAGIAAAIGPALVAIGNLTSGVGKGIQAFASMGKGISSLITQTQAGVGPIANIGSAIGGLSAPILAIVAAIAVLVAAFVNLWKNNEEFREKVTAIWEGIKEKFASFAEGISERLGGIEISFSTVTEAIRKVWDGFCELLAPIFESVFQQISDILSYALDTITGLFDIFQGIFTGNWEQVWNGIQEIFSAKWELIKNTFENVTDMLRNIADTFLGWFGTDWDTVWDTVKETFSNIWDSIKETAGNAVDSIKDTFSNGFEATKETVANIFDSIKEKIDSVMESAKDIIHNAIEKIKSIFDFDWEFPQLKMPHFTISGSFSLNPPSVPHLDVEWYSKAMKNGMILDVPTIFGMNGNHLLAGGETGSETVVGTQSLMKMIADAVNKAGGTQVSYGDLNVYVSSYGTDAAEIANEIGAEISRKLRMAGTW